MSTSIPSAASKHIQQQTTSDKMVYGKANY